MPEVSACREITFLLRRRPGASTAPVLAATMRPDDNDLSGLAPRPTASLYTPRRRRRRLSPEASARCGSPVLAARRSGPISFAWSSSFLAGFPRSRVLRPAAVAGCSRPHRPPGRAPGGRW